MQPDRPDDLYAWIKVIAREGTPFEIAQCMGDLLDRARFAEEIARRQMLERLLKALNEQPFNSLSPETVALVNEMEDLRVAF